MKTTLPKARDAARLAEKVRHHLTHAARAELTSSHARNATQRGQIITLGKRGTHPAWQKASAFLLEPSLAPKVFETLATRYAQRAGGYTRVHKYGHRQGDNAPHAVVELVDGPRDLRFEMAARAAGWDVLSRRLKTRSARALVREGVVVGGQHEHEHKRGIEEIVERERALALAEGGYSGGRKGGGGGDESELRERTRWNLRKALRYRSAEDVKRFGGKVQEHMVRPTPHSPLAIAILPQLQPTLRPALSSHSHCVPFSGHPPRAATGRKSPPGAL